MFMWPPIFHLILNSNLSERWVIPVCCLVAVGKTFIRAKTWQHAFQLSDHCSLEAWGWGYLTPGMWAWMPGGTSWPTLSETWVWSCPDTSWLWASVQNISRLVGKIIGLNAMAQALGSNLVKHRWKHTYLDQSSMVLKSMDDFQVPDSQKLNWTTAKKPGTPKSLCGSKTLDRAELGSSWPAAPVFRPGQEHGGRYGVLW